jgi:tetratricopeptide (TPR) repeat protein
MSEWLSGWLPSPASAEQLGSLDLRAAVRESSDIALDAGERLRLLAVYLEDKAVVTGNTSLARWQVFSRIYEEATRLAPDDPWIPNSMAVTSLDLFQVADDDDPGRNRLWRIALEAAETACRADDTDADLRYTLGYVLYLARPSRTTEALAEFELALALDDGHAWANLYRAHCLHDLERWDEAAAAYGKVNAAAFAGHRAWRIELLREQQAYCLLRAGRRDDALRAFTAVIERREAAISKGQDSLDSAVLIEPPLLLVEAAKGELRAELFDRVEALVESFDEWRRWLQLEGDDA